MLGNTTPSATTYDHLLYPSEPHVAVFFPVLLRKMESDLKRNLEAVKAASFTRFSGMERSSLILTPIIHFATLTENEHIRQRALIDEVLAGNPESQVCSNRQLLLSSNVQKQPDKLRHEVMKLLAEFLECKRAHFPGASLTSRSSNHWSRSCCTMLSPRSKHSSNKRLS
jgi:hypothetical protein